MPTGQIIGQPIYMRRGELGLRRSAGRVCKRNYLMLKQIEQILKTCGTQDGVFPATELYNEGWMLRIILDWFSRQPSRSHPLSFSPNARWFSEALLPSPFLAQHRGDLLSESWTHADGVIGNFSIGKTGKGDLSISRNARHLVVLEAKMFSKLAPGVMHAKKYDQAARNVACIAEVLKRGRCRTKAFSQLGFYVLAPTEQIEKEPSFKRKMSKDSIQHKVGDRIAAYAEREDKEEKENWFEEWFLPVLERIDIGCLTWEEIIDYIEAEDTMSGKNIERFYKECLRYNRQINHKNQS